VYGLAIAPTDPSILYAATPSGILHTTDAGATWTSLGGGTHMKAVRLHPLAPDTMYIGGDDGVFRRDAGGVWVAMTSGLEGRKVTSLEFAGQDGLLLLAGTAGGACYAWQLATGIEEGRRTGDRGPGTAGSFSVRPNPFVSYCRVTGHEHDEFTIFDHAGRQVGMARGDKIGAGLPAGVYFLRVAQAQAQAQATVQIVKTR
jgi:hypothetical protein